MIIPILIIVNLITSYAIYTLVGETPCSELTYADCASNVISGIGYCYWESTCQTLPCYMIDEVASCRKGNGLPIGAASTYCTSLETFSLYYDNVCCDKSEGKINYAFVRFAKTNDGFYDKASDGSTGLTSLHQQNSLTINQLFTVNPWKIMPSLQNLPTPTNFEQQLGAILNQYQILAPTLQNQGEPFYLERTIYQSLQMLRDFLVLQTTPQNTMRDNLLKKIWSVTLIALFRMVKFNPDYYSNNYFINFLISPYSTNSAIISGQQHQTKIDWTGYSLNSNGYFMIYSFPPEMFGIRNAYSDVICLRPINESSLIYNNTENYFDTSFKSLIITWSWSDPLLTVVGANLKLFQFPINNALETEITQVIGVTFTCNMTNKQCVSSKITAEPPNTGVNYYITTGLGATVDKDKVQCRLQGKTWSGTICS